MDSDRTHNECRDFHILMTEIQKKIAGPYYNPDFSTTDNKQITYYGK
jgi:hypothetical protein